MTLACSELRSLRRRHREAQSSVLLRQLQPRDSSDSPFAVVLLSAFYARLRQIVQIIRQRREAPSLSSRAREGVGKQHQRLTSTEALTNVLDDEHNRVGPSGLRDA